MVNEARGTGWQARHEQVSIGGKTGTVQVISNSPKGDKLPERFRDHGWFVAFAPVENPQLAIVILGEHGGRGGSTYAPIARKIVEYYEAVADACAAVTCRGATPLTRQPVAATSFVPNQHQPNNREIYLLR